MQKHLFISKFKQNLAQFEPFSAQKVTLNSPYFSKSSECVCVFVAEMKKTAELLAAQEDVLHIEYYAEMLLKQFDTLNKAVEKLKTVKREASFQSSFQFSTKVHRLPPEKRLMEYRKALRALNEKISWLMEQNYNENNELKKQTLQNQIMETEYRKMKCLKAIEDLEQALQFR